MHGQTLTMLLMTNALQCTSTTALNTFARVPKATHNTPKLLPGKNSFMEIESSPEHSRQSCVFSRESKQRVLYFRFFLEPAVADKSQQLHLISLPLVQLLSSSSLLGLLLTMTVADPPLSVLTASLRYWCLAWKSSQC